MTQQQKQQVIKFLSNSPTYSEFSNMHLATITVPLNDKQVTASCIENYFMACKFENTDPEYAERVLNAETPKLSKKLGSSREHPIRKDWDSHRFVVMRRALLAKFTQHKDLQKLLVETGEKILQENNPYDNFWGIGQKGDGENHLGKELMNLRSELRWMQKEGEKQNVK